MGQKVFLNKSCVINVLPQECWYFKNVLIVWRFINSNKLLYLTKKDYFIILAPYIFSLSCRLHWCLVVTQRSGTDLSTVRRQCQPGKFLWAATLQCIWIDTIVGIHPRPVFFRQNRKQRWTDKHIGCSLRQPSSRYWRIEQSRGRSTGVCQLCASARVW